MSSPKEIADDLKAHEAQCNDRHDKINSRLSTIETDISWIKKYQWMVISIMVAGIVGFYIERIIL